MFGRQIYKQRPDGNNKPKNFRSIVLNRAVANFILGKLVLYLLVTWYDIHVMWVYVAQKYINTVMDEI